MSNNNNNNTRTRHERNTPKPEAASAQPTQKQALLDHLLRMMDSTTSMVNLHINAEGLSPAHVAEVLRAGGEAMGGLLTLYEATVELQVTDTPEGTPERTPEPRIKLVES